MVSPRIQEWFSAKARSASVIAGRSETFFLTILGIVIWACFGPVFRYSDTWQLIINTATTLATTILVLLVQNAQNRDNIALHAKLDELIRVSAEARNTLIGVEEKTERELETVRSNVTRLASIGEQRDPGDEDDVR